MDKCSRQQYSLDFTNVVLASASPRRLELLKLLFDKFETIISHVDETIDDNISPSEAVCLLALRKASAVACTVNRNTLVIGADTVVCIDGTILGKPKTEEQAADMLRKLSGRKHQVYTGVALCLDGEKRKFYCETTVELATLSENEIDWYVKTGEPMDKAGAYGIQGLAARFVKRISGDFYNAMGLPISVLYENIGLITR